MNDREQTPDHPASDAAKSRHLTKPSFDVFFDALSVATAKPPKAGLPELQQILNIGFADKVDSELIVKVAEALKAYSAADRWAVPMATREVTGNLKKFQQQVLAQVRSHYARQIGFFELDLDGPNTRLEVDKWLRRSAPRRKPQLVKVPPGNEGAPLEASVGSAPHELSFESWLRWSFVCLLSESSPEKRMEGMLALVEFWAGRTTDNNRTRQPEPEWYRFIAKVLGAEKLNNSRLDPVLNGLHVLKAQLNVATQRQITLDRDLEEARREVSDLRSAENAARGKLADAKTTLEAQQAEIEKLKINLADAENRYQLLDEHWKRSSATSLARKVGSLIEEMGHEVQEAILSLDRENPNLTMALNRLRRLQSIIQREAGHDEEIAQ